uniref:cysteine--tRNA ligase n=1 Tax=Chromera velia CCMP2878 TaxID=1169474 RepID=A0A0G4HVR6_9ALVE|eukprot:Cvel_1412.t1-p1 / transcript=Cvel_1412.t1 / gene=Cvel_1412 / organism=Chromera_velia_CCMP2878 / gene_product=Cysteine--tRNA ligase, putative / transcript_product=Cysteine--tRNA ligase, putative / location=Cvel_scaffold49:83104-88333(+) / protein_length=698 / sequence_SO=supercontig / SO=protein_coding / is_pseudo=false
MCLRKLWLGTVVSVVCWWGGAARTESPAFLLHEPLASRVPRRGRRLRRDANRFSVVETADVAATDKKETAKVEARLFNTETRQKDLLRPPVSGGNTYTFYSCGPTIYDTAHIGNFRAFLTYDILKRWLRFLGYGVRHVCNLTDVDDKIINRINREGTNLKALTDKYAELFFEDLKMLNIQPADDYPRATNYVGEMIDMISKLVKEGFAYEAEGGVFFRVSAFSNYGRLTKSVDFSNLKAGAAGAVSGPRIFQQGGGEGESQSASSEDDAALGGGQATEGDGERSSTEDLGTGGGERARESFRDFALWKAYKESDGEVFWESPFGKGRPGWHIECSAMARALLGETVDLHGGGEDLVFPHHENEIAQSEAHSGCRFCNHWVHNGFVTVQSEKMSKSKGNFRTLREVCAAPTVQSAALSVRAFRWLVVSSQYRQPLNFSPESISAARKTLKRLDSLMDSLRGALGEGGEGAELLEEAAEKGEKMGRRLLKTANTQARQFELSLADDLNSPRAAAALFTLVKETERALAFLSDKKTTTSTDRNHSQTGVPSEDSAPPSPTRGGSALEVLLSGMSESKAVLVRMDSVFGVLYSPPQSSIDALVSQAAATGTSLLGVGDAEELREYVCRWSGSDGSGSEALVGQGEEGRRAEGLLRDRSKARKEKDFTTADIIRDELLLLGYVIKDAKEGAVEVWKELVKAPS